MFFSLSRPLTLALAIFSHSIVAFPEGLIRDSKGLVARGAPSQLQVHRELGPQLSQGASIYFPSTTQFENTTERWSSYTVPSFAMVVVPATTQDVSAAVKFANKYDIPFLAVNQAHGTVASLSNVKQGVNIYVHAFDTIEVAADGNSALLGGGTYVDLVLKTLAQHNKVATSGTCGCVGMLGSGLGGGLGKYMGYFGLVLDNIIDMTVVIADGSIVTVSATSHSDLYWGMRGAGHNFGIVTQFNYKIYDTPAVDWFRVSYIFTQDKLESLFHQINILNSNGTQPKEVGEVYTLMMTNYNVSKTEPVFLVNIYYAGTEAAALPYLEPFLALDPVLNDNSSLPYQDIPDHEGTGLDGPVCAPGFSQLLFPTGLLSYNVTTVRAAYHLYSDMVTKHPQFNESFVQFENYAVEGMKAVPADSTAYPHREDNCLASYNPQYPPGVANDQIAFNYGHQARALFHGGDIPGREFNAYVNYATGDESLEAMYGYEPWRLENLRALKAKYDPLRKFNFYAPIY